jgi:cytochrome d ubiquinol oxidase subunit II
MNRVKLSMLINAFAIALGAGALFIGLFPRVMVSSISPEFSLTVYNAA